MERRLRLFLSFSCFTFMPEHKLALAGGDSRFDLTWSAQRASMLSLKTYNSMQLLRCMHICHIWRVSMHFSEDMKLCFFVEEKWGWTFCSKVFLVIIFTTEIALKLDAEQWSVELRSLSLLWTILFHFLKVAVFYRNWIACSSRGPVSD